MKYFSKDFIQFLRELNENNNKEWFDENRKRYEQNVKKPFELFIGDLILAVQEFDPKIQINPKKAIFRINRDVRFSKDKTLYKTQRSAVLNKRSRKEEFPAYYLRIDQEQLHIGGGLFNLSTEGLYKAREEIMYNEEGFTKAIQSRSFKDVFGDLKGEKNKVLRAPFKEVAEETPVLYQKQFYYMTSFSNQKILEEDIVPFIVKQLQAAYPLNKFFQEAFTEE